MRIGEYVPFANQQFHDALDEIEVEIVCESVPNPSLGHLCVQMQGWH